ncbi:enoyl-CoA hydratase/isomerase family protein [Aquabacterium sp. A08]|uniref:enoyl-CoA hydratase/isomerase family protein n=2 Tax=Aquabacterium sp. A08 TaxID=2718532 RepID=UPI0014220F27|nr:enoyl-CoA hydratase/isomerase family protein [Aquabacterium sp. A08]NIC42419.1 enoyl-CoA hydratase/isomerase family protein [Aquabacterium sp. A08]
MTLPTWPTHQPWPDASPPILTVADGVATLTLNRPAHRNRLHDEDLRTLLQQFEALNDDPQVRVLVLTARTWPHARVFSAGYHIGEFNDSGHAPLAFEQVPDALARVRALTVCALSGSVYGGATDLALACDFRIGVEGMELRMPAAALGLHYYPSGLRRYVARLGLGATRRLFLLAEATPADELLALGYLDRLVPPEALPAAVAEWADRAAHMAPLALQGMKQTIQEIAWGEDKLADWRSREALTQGSRDFAEGRAAFAERRAPVFSGR